MMIDFISDRESSKLTVEIPESQFLLVAFIAKLSAISLPWIPLCDGTHKCVTLTPIETKK